jgi:hypothetical protein
MMIDDDDNINNKLHVVILRGMDKIRLNSMQQRPWKINTRSAAQQIPPEMEPEGSLTYSHEPY